MKLVVFAGVIGLSLATGFLPIQDNQFWDVDFHHLITDGANVVKDIVDGNEGQALTSGVDVVGDLLGNHALGVDAGQTVKDAIEGKGLATVGEDALKTVGDLTNYEEIIHDGTKAIHDIASGHASVKTLAEDGINIAGDLTGNSGLAHDINGGINDVSSLLSHSNSENAEDQLFVEPFRSPAEEEFGEDGQLVNIPAAFLNEMF
jgi:hypothetical protein